MQKRNWLYIGGRWVHCGDGAMIDVLNPATEETIGSVPAADEREIDAAVHAARAALDEWSTTSPMLRADYLQRIADGIEILAEEFAQLVTAEVGTPIKLSRRLQVGLPIAQLKQCATLVSEHALEKRVGNSLVTQEPVGVVACITPWNYPLHQIVAKLASAVAAGCTVVLKPSELAPLNAFLLADVIDKAGLPPGVVNLVSGHGNVAGHALVRHPDVDMVSFTGSTIAGRHIASAAAHTIKRVALELGGKSASIVLEDADFETAVHSTVNACCLNSGQTCTALTRLIVPESRYREASSIAVRAVRRLEPGDPTNERTRLGPLVSADQRDQVWRYITRGLAEGAELLCGGLGVPEGCARGYFVRPTILGRVSPTSVIAQEEIFGPVLAVLTYPDGRVDEALRIANGTSYGLSGAVWSSNETSALKVARRLRTGQVEINGGPFNLLAPFGGFKQSGIGRELGQYGLEEFLEYKAIQLPVRDAMERLPDAAEEVCID